MGIHEIHADLLVHSTDLCVSVFYSAGTVYKESTFRMTAAQTSSGIMTLACVGLVIPAACKRSSFVAVHADIDPLTT